MYGLGVLLQMKHHWCGSEFHCYFITSSRYTFHSLYIHFLHTCLCLFSNFQTHIDGLGRGRFLWRKSYTFFLERIIWFYIIFQSFGWSTFVNWRKNLLNLILCPCVISNLNCLVEFSYKKTFHLILKVPRRVKQF